jgi:DNA-binding NtrC family response regulator
VDDDKRFAEECRIHLSPEYEIRHFERVPEDPSLLLADPVDAILMDISLPGRDGIETVRLLRKGGSDLPIIMLTQHRDVATVVSALKAGASNYVSKDQPVSYLREVIAREIEHCQARREARLQGALGDLYRDGPGETPLVGRSPALKKIQQEIQRLAALPVDVLITGETGVGKELVARALHRSGPRRTYPFVVLSLPDISPTLFESTLFGYERGAFTGAEHPFAGAFEAVGDGDLFLDEVSEIPLELQAKLLRVLEDRTFHRLGSHKPIRFRGRIIAATNQDLEALVQEGRFRRDLYYRLRVYPIHIPPLRERKEDILPIAQLLLQREASRLGRPARRFAPEVEEDLCRHDWAGGNGRELRDEIVAALVRCDGEVIQRHHISGSTPEPPSSHPEVGAEGSGPYLGMTYTEARRWFEARYASELLESCGGVVNEAARRAGMDPSSFRRLLRRIRQRPES